MEVREINANDLIKGALVIRIKWTAKARLRIIATKWLVMLIQKIGVAEVELEEIKIK